MKSIKESAKSLLRRTGFELRRYTVQTSADAQLLRGIQYLGIDLIIDVGGNVGDYGFALRDHGYRGRVVSFEPLSSAHAALMRRASSDRDWIVAPRVALGAVRGKSTLNISRNSISSSMMRMLPSHEKAAPESVYVGTEEVEVHTLDEATASYLGESRRILLKIDTQGYEDAVLDGAVALLKKVTAVQLELSLVPLYENQVLLDGLRARLEEVGFELYALLPVYADETTGRTLQLDGIFVRRDDNERD